MENSVKFAVAPRREGGEIAVYAERAADSLVIDVWGRWAAVCSQRYAVRAWSGHVAGPIDKLIRVDGGPEPHQ